MFNRGGYFNQNYRTYQGNQPHGFDVFDVREGRFPASVRYPPRINQQNPYTCEDSFANHPSYQDWSWQQELEFENDHNRRFWYNKRFGSTTPYDYSNNPYQQSYQNRRSLGQPPNRYGLVSRPSLKRNFPNSPARDLYLNNCNQQSNLKTNARSGNGKRFRKSITQTSGSSSFSQTSQVDSNDGKWNDDNFDNIKDFKDFSCDVNERKAEISGCEDLKDKNSAKPSKTPNIANDGGDKSDNNEHVRDKNNTVKPSKEAIIKYKYYPPSPQELEDLLKGLVVVFSFTKRDPKRRKYSDAIKDSFSMSAQFDPLDVKDGFWKKKPEVRFHTIRWNGIILCRGMSSEGTLDSLAVNESRVRAGYELINNLAMTCYSLEMKDEYFSIKAMKEMLLKKELPGVYKVVSQREILKPATVKDYIKNFLKDDTDCELVVTHIKEGLLNFAIENGYDYRCFRHDIIAISNKRSLQYWRDKILASGKMEDERFKLIPPQGIGNNLLSEMDLAKQLSFKLKNHHCIVDQGGQYSRYGPEIEDKIKRVRLFRNKLNNRRMPNKQWKLLRLTKREGFRK